MQDVLKAAMSDRAKPRQQTQLPQHPVFHMYTPTIITPTIITAIPNKGLSQKAARNGSSLCCAAGNYSLPGLLN
jgi:hypothetical protein